MKSQTMEEIMNDVATQIETNTKTMMILFDERKEMYYLWCIKGDV